MLGLYRGSGLRQGLAATVPTAAPPQDLLPPLPPNSIGSDSFARASKLLAYNSLTRLQMGRGGLNSKARGAQEGHDCQQAVFFAHQSNK